MLWNGIPDWYFLCNVYQRQSTTWICTRSHADPIVVCGSYFSTRDRLSWPFKVLPSWKNDKKSTITCNETSTDLYVNNKVRWMKMKYSKPQYQLVRKKKKKKKEKKQVLNINAVPVIFLGSCNMPQNTKDCIFVIMKMIKGKEHLNDLPQIIKLKVLV